MLINIYKALHTATAIYTYFQVYRECSLGKTIGLAIKLVPINFKKLKY